MSTPPLQLTQAGFQARPQAPALSWLASAGERIVAAAILLILLPLLTAALLAVIIVSHRSPFIAHKRVGRFGSEFWMLKIRTMWGGDQPSARRGWIEYISETHVPVDKSAPDPRVTSKLAALYRRFSLDELPQLIHVLSGRMRLVGPRPVTRHEWNLYYGADALEVLSVPPGITGLWQVMGRNRLTYAQRRRLDVFYARRRSLRFDLMVLLRTPARVLSGRDAG